MRRTEASSPPLLAACRRALAVVLAVVASRHGGRRPAADRRRCRTASCFPTTTACRWASGRGSRRGAFVARTDDAAAAWYNPGRTGPQREERPERQRDGLRVDHVHGRRLRHHGEPVAAEHDVDPGVGRHRRADHAGELAARLRHRPAGVVAARRPSTRRRFTNRRRATSGSPTRRCRTSRPRWSASPWAGKPAPRLRLGAGLGLAWTSLSLDQGITDHLVPRR